MKELKHTEKQTGVIAQWWMKMYPEAVTVYKPPKSKESTQLEVFNADGCQLRSFTD